MMDECGDKVNNIRHKHESTCLISKKSKIIPRNAPRPVLSNREITDPDRKLITWEKMVQERKKLMTKLTKTIEREPVDTTMNSGINVREIRERKMIIEHAQIELKAEIRDHQPWEQPLRLHQKCSYHPVYELQRTTVEMGKVPEMEYVAIPEYIQKEEHGIESKAKLHGGFEKSVYKANREKELEDKIRLMEPHRPILNSLVIKGNRPVKIEKKLPLPEVIIMKPYIPCITDMTEVYALRINNTVLIKDHKLHDLAHLWSMQKEKWHRNISLWTYYFNAPVGKMSRNKFILTNLGTVTLRYCWQSVKQETKSQPRSVSGPVYFFNKNEDVLSPGQTREITLIFVSSVTGIYKEQWKFNVCNVNFLQPGKEFIIRLNADAVELNLNYINGEVKNLKKFIASEEINFMVHITENYLVNKSVEVPPPENYAYEKMFLDDDIFVMKNPDCYYHQTEVENLKQLYGIVIAQKNATWNLSLETLEKTIMKQQYDDRMRSYDKLKNAYQLLIKPFEERVFLPERKLFAMRQQLDQFIDKFECETHRLKVSYCRYRTVARRLSWESNSFNERVYQKLFYMVMRDHFCDAIESGVALLNSLDLYRPLEFT